MGPIRKMMGGALVCAAVVTLVGAGLAACGGDDDEADTYIISNNHSVGPHQLFISAADLDAPGGKTFDITGLSVTHTHTVRFSETELQLLKGGQRISAQSTLGDNDAHFHQVTVFAVSR